MKSTFITILTLCLAIAINAQTFYAGTYTEKVERGTANSITLSGGRFTCVPLPDFPMLTNGWDLYTTIGLAAKNTTVSGAYIASNGIVKATVSGFTGAKPGAMNKVVKTCNFVYGEEENGARYLKIGKIVYYLQGANAYNKAKKDKYDAKQREAQAQKQKEIFARNEADRLAREQRENQRQALIAEQKEKVKAYAQSYREKANGKKIVVLGDVKVDKPIDYDNVDVKTMRQELITNIATMVIGTGKHTGYLLDREVLELGKQMSDQQLKDYALKNVADIFITPNVTYFAPSNFQQEKAPYDFCFRLKVYYNLVTRTLPDTEFKTTNDLVYIHEMKLDEYKKVMKLPSGSYEEKKKAEQTFFSTVLKGLSRDIVNSIIK